MKKGHEIQSTQVLHAIEKEGRGENRPIATEANKTIDGEFQPYSLNANPGSIKK